MGPRMKAFLFGCVVSFFWQEGNCENTLFSPFGELRSIYETERAQSRSSIARFQSWHRKCHDLVKDAKGNVGDLSLIWYGPFDPSAEAASVFWGTNEIIVVTMNPKGAARVKAYAATPEMTALRGCLMMALKDYDFACPLGGDGNVIEVGVLRDGIDSVPKCFSIQVGRCFRAKRGKMFCGTAESVSAYECMVSVYDTLRRLTRKERNGCKLTLESYE